jgi:FKBP-type peptidyl-prolyl cis-trans isomerase
LKSVIKGWTEGVQLVGEGGMIELNVPSALGYGDRGTGPIPPKAQLHFIVELISVK